VRRGHVLPLASAVLHVEGEGAEQTYTYPPGNAEGAQIVVLSWVPDAPPFGLRKRGARALPGMCQSLRAGAKTRSDGNRVGEARPVPAGPGCRGPADETRNTSILRAHSYRDW